MVVKGFTMSSVTVGWSPPPEALAEYVHYYELLAREPGRPERANKEAVHSGNFRNLPYMFDNLTPDTSYIFRVSLLIAYHPFPDMVGKELVATKEGAVGRDLLMRIEMRQCRQ